MACIIGSAIIILNEYLTSQLVYYGGGGSGIVIARGSVRKKKLVARTWRRLVLHVHNNNT